MQARGGHTDDHIAPADTLRPQHLVLLHDTDGCCRDVVLVLRHHTGVLRRLTAEEGTPCSDTALGNALHNLGDMLRHNLADSDVILQEQWLRTAHHQVIHAHGDKVNADRVVDPQLLGNHQLRSHTVRTCGKQRLLVLPQREQTGETAQPPAHLRPRRPLGVRREQFHSLIPSLDINAGGGIRVVSHGHPLQKN